MCTVHLDVHEIFCITKAESHISSFKMLQLVYTVVYHHTRICLFVMEICKQVVVPHCNIANTHARYLCDRLMQIFIMLHEFIYMCAQQNSRL